MNKLGEKGEKMYNIIIKHKVKMAKKIYLLLTTICKNNNENEIYVYEKFPKIQYQVIKLSNLNFNIF